MCFALRKINSLIEAIFFIHNISLAQSAMMEFTLCIKTLT